MPDNIGVVMLPISFVGSLHYSLVVLIPSDRTVIHLDSHPASGHGDEVGRCLPQLLQTYEQHDKDSEEEWDPWETNLPVGITAQPKNSNVCGPFVWTMCGKIVAECARQENTTDVLSAISEWNVDSSDYAEIRTTSKAKVQALQRQYGTFEQRKNTSTRSRSSPSSSSGHRASPLSGSSWFPDSSLSSSSSTSSSSSSSSSSPSSSSSSSSACTSSLVAAASSSSTSSTTPPPKQVRIS